MIATGDPYHHVRSSILQSQLRQPLCSGSVHIARKAGLIRHGWCLGSSLALQSVAHRGNTDGGHDLDTDSIGPVDVGVICSMVAT